MRIALASPFLLTLGSALALADGEMKQSPLLAREAGAACAHGHQHTRGESNYRMAGCDRSGR